MKYAKYLTAGALLASLMFGATASAVQAKEVSFSESAKQKTETRFLGSLRENFTNIFQKKNINDDISDRERTERKTDEKLTKEKRFKKYTGLVEHMMGRVEKVIGKYDRRADILEKRMEKLQNEGKNVDRARRLISTARTDIANATRSLESAKITFRSEVRSDSDKPLKEIFLKTRTHLADARDDLRSAWDNLVNAYKAMK